MRRELVGKLLSQRGVPADSRGKRVRELGDHPVVIHSTHTLAVSLWRAAGTWSMVGRSGWVQ